MSSSSDSEQYTSSEEEFIRTKNYKTRSGRTSRTRYRQEFSDIVIPIQIILKVAAHLILIVHQIAKPWQR